MANNTTKAKRKALASNIVSSIEARLGESGETTKKIKKSIEKSADKLAKKLTKLMDKDASKKAKADKKDKKKDAKAKKNAKKAEKHKVKAEKNAQRAANVKTTQPQDNGSDKAPALSTPVKPTPARPRPPVNTKSETIPKGNAPAVKQPTTKPNPEPIPLTSADTN